MRPLLFLLGIYVGALAMGTRAEAQNYPWCALYRDGGAQNCGFTTFEQCMETVRGTGAFCNENTQYVARPAPSRQRH